MFFILSRALCYFSKELLNTVDKKKLISFVTFDISNNWREKIITAENWKNS